MAVKFSKVMVTSTTTKMPTSSGVTWTEGINAPGNATYEYLMLRGDCTWSTGTPTTGDMATLLSSIRIIINGEVVHDFTSSVTSNSAEVPGTYAYFLNSIGGMAYGVPDGTTTREWYWQIPIGRTYGESVVRIETVVTWATAAQAIASGTLEWWVKTNDDVANTTTVAPSTSFQSANSIEQVVVRIPQNVPGVVSGILVQNDSAADELGAQGIRVNAISDFGIEPQMLRLLNSDLANGIMQTNQGTSATQQTYDFQVKGCIWVPCYGLTGGDIVLSVDDNSGSTTTRTYTPVITSPLNSKAAQPVRQTEKKQGNTVKAILAKAD